MSSLLVYKPANLFIIVSKYFFPIPLLKISSVTISADVFLYQPEFPWLNSSNIYLLTLLNADTFSFALLHTGLNSIQIKLTRIYIFLPLPALPKQPFLTLNTLWIIHMTAEIRTIQIRHFI